ncbi:rhamnulokinase [Alistipes sp. Z76]|nr:rhamnulokinase [Alistipes sp. Z76]NCE66716.1 rhamnulokinase [Muribaculaceae bacterium M3]
MAIHRFAAVDLGATSGRVILAAIDGDEIALEEISRFPDPIIEMQGHFYWDLPAIYKSVIEGLGAIAARGVAIESVGIDTWGVDFAMFGRDGALLRLPYCYRDPHTDGAPEKFFERMPCKTLYEKTGIQIMNFNSVFQFDALRRNGCSALEAADKILFIPDALAYMLTGNAVTEYTIASTAQMIDPRTKQWDPDIMNELGLSPEKFGRMTMSGDMIGTLTAEAQRLTGLGAVPVVAVASHDTGSAVAAVPAEDDNFAYLSSGTWSLMGIESKEPIIDERSFAMNFTNEGGVEGTVRVLKNICGMWLLERCRAEWPETNYSEIATAAELSEPFRSVINPDAPCFANPLSMTEAIADYCRRTGQPVPESVGQYARCIFESLALRYRQVIEMLKTLSPHPIEKLYVIGGGARNEMLNRFTADATGIPVETGSSESTALGNVMMQAKHAGVAGSVAEMRGMIRASLADSRRYEPTDGEKWQAAYEMYLRRTGEA